MTLGQKITNLRKAHGMTQEELSEAVGVTRQTISKWELDSSTPDLDYLCKLCDLFGVTADDLIRPEKETSESTPPLPRTKTTPPSSSTPSARTISGVRFAGWMLLILGIALIQVDILFVLFRSTSTALWLLGGVFIGIGLELFLIRWKPLFIAMWTVWLIWTFIQFVLNSHVFIFFTLNWASIFLILWVAYTGFCIGVTVGVIRKHIRQNKPSGK